MTPDRIALIREISQECQVIRNVLRDHPTRDDAPQLRLRLAALAHALAGHARVFAGECRGL